MNYNDQVSNSHAIPPLHPSHRRKLFHSIDINGYTGIRSPLVKKNATQTTKNSNSPIIDCSPLRELKDTCTRLISGKKLHQCATTRAKSPQERHLAKQKNFFLPMQYEILREQRKKLLKEYYKARKEIRKKYETMITALNNEEAEAIRWVNMKGWDTEDKVKDIRQDYAMSINLIQQQKLVEEEELVNKYKVFILETYI